MMTADREGPSLPDRPARQGDATLDARGQARAPAAAAAATDPRGEDRQGSVSSFALYVHIPYCLAKCPYCDFNSYAVARWPEQRYLAALLGEMGRRAEEPPWRGTPAKTLFFGGGTPSLFAPESIEAILDRADSLFGIESGAEITLEANPGTVDRAKLEGLRRAGVNRLSVGAQSFRPATLETLGRNHDADQTRQAVRLARRAGFEQLNLDLIYAVPGQTSDDVVRDVREAVALEPDHVSAYCLTFEPGTQFHSLMKSGRLLPPSADREADFLGAVNRELASSAFERYEISNYARPGCQARHNLAYWRAEPYLGLGAGAHSFGPAGGRWRRWWNERSPERYCEAVLGGAARLAETGEEWPEGRGLAGEFVFLNLRLQRGFALLDFERRTGCSFGDLFSSEAARLVDAGLLRIAEGRVRLTERGLELADSVFACFV